MLWRGVVLLAALTIFVVQADVEVARTPKVVLSLQTSWAATALIDEASEALALEDSALFWTFAEYLFNLPNGDDLAHNSHLAYNLTMQFAADQQLPAITLDLLRIGLAVHEFSAVVQAHRQVFMQYAVPAVGATFRNCEAWVAISGQHQFCTAEELQAAITKKQLLVEGHTEVDLGHTYDVFLPDSSHTEPPTAVLYGSLGNAATAKLHHVLVDLAKNSVVKYIFRHRPRSADAAGAPAYLAGYGVELAIKSTEYKAVDDDKPTAESVGKSTTSFGEDDDAGLPATLEPISSKMLSDLSIQVLTKVLQSSEPLRTLRHLTQNLPSVATSLVHVPLPFISDEAKNSMNMQMRFFESSLFVNGLQLSLSLDTITPYSLLPLLRRERLRVQGLVSAGFSRADAIDLISHSSSSSSSDYTIDIRSVPVIFVNDLEKDERYYRFSNSFATVLNSPVFGGNMVYARFNLVSPVFVLSPTRLEHFQILVRITQYIYRNIPLRFGLWFVDENPEMVSQLAKNETDTVVPRSQSIYVQFMRLLQSVLNSNPKSVHDYLFEICRSILGTMGPITTESFQYAYRMYGNAPFKTVIEGDQVGKYDGLLIAHSAAAVEKGVSSDSLFVNGQFVRLNLNFEGEMMPAYYNQIEIIREMIRANELTPEDNIYEKVLSSGKAYSKISSFISPSKNAHDGSEKAIPFVDLAPLLDLQQFFFAKDEDAILPVTHVLVGDWSQEENFKHFSEALLFVQSSTYGRITFVDSSSPAKLNIIQQTLAALSHAEPSLKLRREEPLKLLSNLLAAVIESENDVDESILTTTIAAIDPPLRQPQAFLAAVADWKTPQKLQQWKSEQSSLLRTLNKHVPLNAVSTIANGRILTPLPEDFGRGDFSLLDVFEYRQRVEPIEWKVKAQRFAVPAEQLDGRFYSNVFARVVSVLGHNVQPREPPRLSWPIPNSFSVGASKDSCLLDIYALVDPLSNVAQRLSSVLLTLAEIADVRLTVALHTRTEYSELPVKRFYRFAVATQPRFDDSGHLLPTEVVFNGVPADLLLTLAIDEPQSWLVGSVSAVRDLDNLKLSQDEEHPVHAIFALENIIVEGHSFETNNGAPPRGLQLVLGTPSNPASVDTIVMANYGYFQLQANPGLWQMRLREGRSVDLYRFARTPAAIEPEISAMPVVIKSFVTERIFAGVHKRPGRESDELLRDSDDDGEKSKSFWTSFTERIVGKEKVITAANATVHIFSLASGHLYERLLRIMILSVKNHTQSPLKFWFIQNFASPQFKELIPLMAQKYDFEYQFVTYKWPQWLRAQTEKQRIIWAYKILFLDVLFPLNLDRVIFVDADEIVRADLKELADIDLKGAPYGYTPFCNSRHETDGFRFWKGGWWQGHLQGKPYHISALYVIDLKRFREIAAGDRLRGTYQMLSHDPSSLANLDQDLPNHMQNDLPMFSLPQEWLWCETWCSDESLAKAKVIDLCNNPLTKEPKLAVAQRLLPEWNQYDQELREFQELLASEGKLQHVVVSPSKPAANSVSDPIAPVSTPEPPKTQKERTEL